MPARAHGLDYNNVSDYNVSRAAASAGTRHRNFGQFWAHGRAPVRRPARLAGLKQAVARPG
ncbi:hypothetical protein BCD48_16405 [Pseudofrankia sp. BMG5.36]|nr:hypothetical protein BCD48_16405 [Pseudofrankia sp. BMG5.36]